jgi:succinate dehydrogenase / fumarate reductase, cytochrome b subunit
MTWVQFLTSSVGKKLVMALSGLFLITFLVIHVGLNACIFNDLSFFDSNDDGKMFNRAAHFMGSSWVIRLIEIGLFIGFFIHIIQGYVLTVQNKKRRAVGYKVPMGSRGSAWYRKSMGLLGTLILLFLIVHISNFWIHSRVTQDLPEKEYIPGGARVGDLFSLMVNVFHENSWSLWMVILYVAACISLAWHLVHGFQASFRSLGLYNTKYIGLINAFGIAFSIIVPLIFALMPVSMYLGWVGYGN